MSANTPLPDPDAWLDDVRRWLFGGTAPPSYADSELPGNRTPVAGYSPAADVSRDRNKDTGV